MTAPDECVRRILDANLNRAREGLRVIEEHARFVHEDAAAAAEIKSLRHALRTLAEKLGCVALLAARAVDSDVGRDLKSLGEMERGSAAEVVSAAVARAGEALRVVAEYGKLMDADAALWADRLRYGLYSLEPRVLLRGPRLAAFRGARVYALLSGALCRRGWEPTLAAWLEAGVRCVQIREKTLSDAELLARAQQARAMTRAAGALLGINDRPDIARLCSADLLHLGQHDMPVREARRVAGGEVLIGKSTHDAGELNAALDERPDYIAVGPLFASSTKPASPVAGPAFLRHAREQTLLPIVAIGGIDTASAASVFAAGADVIAVCAALTTADDPAVAARELLAAAGVGYSAKFSALE